MGNVTKKYLVEKISEKTGLKKVVTKKIIIHLLEEIACSLENGKNIEIRGFGRFKIKEHRARLARNPRTGETIHVKKGIKPKFEASRELRKRMNIEDFQ